MMLEADPAAIGRSSPPPLCSEYFNKE